MVGFLLVVDEDTKGDFMAREKETKNRILEGVKKKNGNQQSSPRKNLLKGWPREYSPGRKKKFFFSQQERGQQCKTLARVSRRSKYMIRGGEQLEVTGDVQKSRLSARKRIVYLLPRLLKDQMNWLQ